MTVRARWLARLASVLVALALATLAGCGRSSLLDDVLVIDQDGGAEGGACNGVTCTGCCANGVCVGGSTLQECGVGGVACDDCTQQGPSEVCSPSQGGCVSITPPNGCDQFSCANGCCDVNGLCQPGNASGACGDFGNSCENCGAEGLACDPKLQACLTSTCGPQCAGCCSNGVCVGGAQDTSCGTGGAQCSNCITSGFACAPDPLGGGACEAPGCNASNCAGCCSKTGCTSGTLAAACGSEGDACITCTGASQECVALPGLAGGGLCTTTACGPQNCFGCCDLNGLCQTGTNANDCGAGGKTCTTCKGGQACVNAGCTTAATCDPSNCAGCCQGTTCLGGGDDGACGFGGEACMPCSNGGSCVGNVCQTSGPCSASNCNGCCVGNSCFNGTDDSDCGANGKACVPCPTNTQCTGGSCVANAPCGPSNCSGCCDAKNNCQGGTTGGTCGSGGVACVSCGTDAQCVAGFCEPTCGPGTCSGCCVSGVCAVGTQDGACGTNGATCSNCTTNGDECAKGTCITRPCGPANCAGCCNASGVCVGGTDDAACGKGGASCSDCQSSKDVCTANACVPSCGPANCAGCCDTQGTCEAGFLGTACGSGGAACANCTNGNSTCDVAVTPRLCKNQQTTCPAPYPSCPSGTTVTPPKTQKVCSAQDLTEAQAACAGGAASAGCTSFFTTEKQINAACASCLEPFDVPFADQTGVFLCASPFVNASCDNDVGCFEDCEAKTCTQCPAGSATTQCQNQARTGNCATWFNGLTCVAPVLAGTASFCSPTQYNGFGGWLRGVGGHYCGN